MTTDTQTPPPPSTADASPETVRKVYAKDLREKDPVHTVFRVSQKSRVTARSGKVFLSLTLVDKSGEIDARVFDKVEALEPVFASGDYVLVRGSIIAFHGKPQVVLEAIERLDPEPLDPQEFEPPVKPEAPAASSAPADTASSAPSASASEESSSTPPKAREESAAPKQGGEAPGSGQGGARAVGQIRELLAERVSDPHVKALLVAFLEDARIASGLPQASAVKGVHHSYRGGLAEHLLSVLRLVLRVSDHYPMADRDLMMAGAFLSNVMKVAETSADKGSEPTDEGRLVGQAVLTAQKIREKTLALPHFPPLLEQHLTHLVISRPNPQEPGAHRPPMTLEAQIVHALDALDSSVAAWTEAMQRDPHERWTEHLKAYDRSLWKGPVPTSRGRAPVEGGGRRKFKEKKPKERSEKSASAGASDSPASPRPERSERPEKQREPRPPREPREPRESRGEPREPRESRGEPREPRGEPREPREPRPPRETVNVPKELTFKPFSVLTSKPESSPEGGGEDSGDKS